ncbi:phage tail tape measure protein [Pseudomonas saudiphocaensis]|uniref:Phage tail fiber protein n=1 Tax=Pseudomonas saudiphocaensis TaxID=1499686 RepID=A0A078LUM1_9PSED|nr:phage tail tape measure protein [Pseudomonas saudiphocaensis]CDZ93571.1 phage tail fiber protein [Pseudomonas saudiphocaensis]
MARDLSLRVNLKALDNATRPLRTIAGGAVGLGRALKETRGELKGLQALQKDVSSFRNLKGATEKTGAALQANRERVKALSREMANTTTPTKALTREFQGAVRQGHNLKQTHAQQQRELQGLRSKLGEAGISTRNLGQHERDLRSKITQTNQALTQQENRLKQVTAQQKRLGQAKEQYERTSALAGSMAATGAGGLATGSGILYAGARMMAPGVQFDADMAKVQALTRLDRNSEHLAAMRAQARQLGADTMFNATEAAQGQGFLAMAGFDPQSILDAMPGMLDLAKAGDSGLAETADIASNILTGFNLKASETGRLGDVLVGAFTRSNTSLQMLGETMKYAAPVAASVGQDIETVAAMAGKLGDAGIQGSMGGTALRAILNRLSAPPAAAAKALDKLGISAVDAQGNLRDMPTVLQEIYEKTKNLGDAERAGLLKGIAGEEAVAGMQVLVAQAGSGALQEFIGTLRQTQGEAQRTAKVMGDNLVGDLDELSSAWEDLGIQLQEQQNGPLREVTQSLASVVGGVKSWIVENPKLAANIVKTAAGVGVLMAGMGGLTLAIASILGPFAMVRYGMMLFGIRGAGLASTLFNLGKTALPLVGKGILFIGRALMANPIGLALTAIAAGAYYIWSNWETLGPKFKALLGAVVGWLAELPENFKQLGSDMISGLVNGITGGLGAVKSAITGAGAKAIGWFKETLGIHSPSRVFAGLGGDTMAGLEQGLAGGESGALKQLAGTAKRLTAAGAVGLGLAGGTPAFADMPPIDSRPPLAARVSAPVVQAAPANITIHVHAAPGQDANAIARAVAAEMAKYEREKGARARSSLYDQD